MVSLEIRRHAERDSEEGSGSVLSAAGIAAARGLRRDAEEFALVITSPRKRAHETAIEIAGHVDETSEFLAGSPDEALTQEQYDTTRSLQDVLELIGGNEHALGFARQQLATWESIARRLRDGTTAFVVTHGGNIVLPAALLARRLGTDVAPLPLSYLEGVRVEYSQGRWRGLERLSANSNSPIVQTEIPLGGNLSQAVRVGDTVRRRAGPWTPAVQSLLAHLETVGFTAAPRSLGFDERGRAVLAYLPGDIHGGWPEPMPTWMFEDVTTLKRAAELLRRYHDAVLTFRPPPDATWHQVAPGRHELICHNDWSPYNAIFREHEPTVMLDWDHTGPGSRVWDVASSAYTWVPLSPKSSELSLAQKAQRLAVFCDTYGDVEPGAVVAVLPEQLRFIAQLVQTGADGGDPGAQKLAGWNVPARLHEEADLLVRQRSDLMGDRRGARDEQSDPAVG
jgi:broad specificity phosphatase PhoE